MQADDDNDEALHAHFFSSALEKERITVSVDCDSSREVGGNALPASNKASTRTVECTPTYGQSCSMDEKLWLAFKAIEESFKLVPP